MQLLTIGEVLVFAVKMCFCNMNFYHNLQIYKKNQMILFSWVFFASGPSTQMKRSNRFFKVFWQTLILDKLQYETY